MQKVPHQGLPEVGHYQQIRIYLSSNIPKVQERVRRTALLCPLGNRKKLYDCKRQIRNDRPKKVHVYNDDQVVTNISQEQLYILYMTLLRRHSVVSELLLHSLRQNIHNIEFKNRFATFIFSNFHILFHIFFIFVIIFQIYEAESEVGEG